MVQVVAVVRKLEELGEDWVGSEPEENGDMGE